MMLRNVLRTAALTVLFVAGGLVTQVAAIVVAPTAVYLDEANPATAISLYNPSTSPEEVSVEAVFGYPTTDEVGNVRLHLDESSADARSAAGLVQVLPRRLVVPPGERRVVRLLARPPADLEVGEYWTRLIFTSRGQRLPVSGEGSDTARVAVGLDLEVRTIIAVTYRHGDVSTGVSVEGFEPEIRGDSLIVRPDLIRRGTGAYIGRMDLRLLAPDGSEVRRWSEQVAVYRAYHRRYRYDVSDVAPGPYRLVLRLDTERDDVPAAARLGAAPVELTAAVVRP
jgi:hypothetical protein